MQAGTCQADLLNPNKRCMQSFQCVPSSLGLLHCAALLQARQKLKYTTMQLGITSCCKSIAGCGTQDLCKAGWESLQRIDNVRVGGCRLDKLAVQELGL